MVYATPNLALDFFKAHQHVDQTAFEHRFNQLQNTVLRRINEESERANEKIGFREREALRIQNKALKLQKSLPVLRAYRQGNLNNTGQLTALSNELQETINTIGADGTVDVDAFNAARDKAAERLKNIYLFHHPDITDGDVIQRLKQNLEQLQNTSTASNEAHIGQTSIAALRSAIANAFNNTNTIEFLTDLRTQVNVARETTKTTVETVYGLEKSIKKKVKSQDLKIKEKSQLFAAEQKFEIEKIQERYANVLRAVSLSYDANAGFGDLLASGLQPLKLDPGSVVSILA